MTIKQFIEKAIEGGWKPESEATSISGLSTAEVLAKVYPERVLLDPFAWQAVGKVEGWDKEIPENHCEVCGEPMAEGETMFRYHGYGMYVLNSGDCPKPPLEKREWRKEMHRMIDALAEGKTIEQYLETL